MLVHVSGIDCLPEHKEVFNKWYNQVHVPMLLEFDGIMKAERFKRIDENPLYPEYLALYEFESLEMFKKYQESSQLAAAMIETRNSWRKGMYERKWRIQYESIKSWQRW